MSEIIHLQVFVKLQHIPDGWLKSKEASFRFKNPLFKEKDVTLIETQKQMIENDIKSREQRESEFNPASLIWAIAGLGVVVLFMGVVGFVLITRIQKSIPGIVAESVKSIVSETNRN